MHVHATLRLDYDTHEFLRVFERGVWVVRHVYGSKRTYVPGMRVVRADRTKKGYHVTMEYYDREAWKTAQERGLATLQLQSCMHSDDVRGVFDMLRIQRHERYHNLLFDYKNGRAVVADGEMVRRLNLVLMKMKMFDGRG